jgi:glyoxylase-like metal-dependent hydrolase (beta-lactamase superfamily II)
MIIETFPVGVLQCNCTILGDEQTGEAIVIDPGDDADEILQRLAKHRLKLKQMVCTHTHIDHVGAIHPLQEHTPTPATIHEADLFLYDKLEEQAHFSGFPVPKRGVIDSFVKDGEAVACGGFEIGVLHTPGHTPGSISLHLAGERNILFTGDTLFMRSIGRTDLWGGSFPEIIASIRTKLMTFDDDTLVVSGHGQFTTIGNERKYNPFLR